MGVGRQRGGVGNAILLYVLVVSVFLLLLNVFLFAGEAEDRW